ncbi:hypothetical protein NP233_g3297 [Leucocoprinus birnbaumii]|uniref:F-box protein n=1 Tax=Leucocoprinus birnbaumii TaxID=56174 RepID=A0AAD5VXB0_9AGAR|nr:hypothetical protein NP233_g3297 [Leucocoprinus birnbaumii]
MGTFQMLDTHNETFVGQIEGILTRRSCEILLHIIANPQFARLVKDMTLVVYPDHPASYEILTLVKALGALRNLRTLRCYGSPSSRYAFEEILEAVPQTLEHILYSTALPLDLTEHLPNLEYLEYRNITYYPEDVWVYNQLVSLEITSDNLDNPINIDFICHHCPELQELSVTGDIWAAVCLSLPPDTTFPKLQSLRLSCTERLSSDSAPKDSHFAALADFLRAHRGLRRLYLRFTNTGCGQIIMLLDIIQTFQNLDVLGIHTGNVMLTEKRLEDLVTRLPLTPKALQLSTAWSSSTGNHVAITMNALSAMPNLEFLHIYGTYSRLPFSPEELAMDLKGLRRVGLTRALWDIVRNGPEVEALKWPRWKIKFFAESDFDDPDDAWLFKYH